MNINNSEAKFGFAATAATAIQFVHVYIESTKPLIELMFTVYTQSLALFSVYTYMVKCICIWLVKLGALYIFIFIIHTAYEYSLSLSTKPII